MNDREWAAFAAECEASFRGDLDTDRELALREHIGDAPLADARAAIARLVAQGHVMAPAPAEMLAALLAVQREGRVRELVGSGSGRRVGEAFGQCWDGCSGQLIVRADDGRLPAELECDTCGQELAVLQADLGLRNTTAPTARPGL